MRNKQTFSIVALVLMAFVVVPSMLLAADQPLLSASSVGVVNIRPTSALVTGYVTAAPGHTVQAWMNVQCDVSRAKLNNTNGIGIGEQVILAGSDPFGPATFSLAVNGLQPATQYYCQMVFTTSPSSPPSAVVSFTTPAVGAPLLDSVVVASRFYGGYSVDAVATSGIWAGGIVRGSLASVYGEGFSTATISSATPVAQLGGITVLVDGVPAGIMGVSPYQVIFVVPQLASAVQTSEIVVVGAKGLRSVPATVNVVAANPNIIGIVDANWSPVTYSWIQMVVGYKTAPLTTNTFTIAALGLGATALGSNGLANLVQPPVVKLDDGTVGAIQFAGLMPGTTGVYQVNVILPAPLTGVHNGTLTVNGVSASFVLFGK